MKNILRTTGGLLAALLLFSQCQDDFLDVANPNEIDAKNFFQTMSDLDLVLTSVYSAQKTQELYGADFLPKVSYGLPKTANQDWLGTNGWNQMYRNEVTPENDLIDNFWQGFYRGVARANDFLTNVDQFVEENQATLTPENLARIEEMRGEARYWRAFDYFHLIRLWGEKMPALDPSAAGVPLILEIPATREEMAVSRATVGQVYEQIIADLLAAEAALPDSWEGPDLARVDAFAAKATLAEVYMNFNDYAAANGYLEEIVNDGSFSLVPFEDYQDLFNGENEFSSESLLEINFSTDLQENMWQGGLGTNLALQIAPKGTGWSNVYPHDVNVLRFGDDPRLRVNMLEPGVDSVVFGDGKWKILEPMVGDEGALGWSFKKYVPIEYSVYSTNRNFGANVLVYRLAGAYLMYAETQNALGNDDVALDYLNRVRRRAYGGDPTTPSAEADLTGLAGDALRDAIYEERFLELFAEGHRWYDIIRWGIAEEEIAKYPTVRSGPVLFNPERDYYFPIPQAELDNNPNIRQSTGYGGDGG